jgi:hypothetical protein
MNQTQAAAEIAKRINSNDEFRAKVKFVKCGVVVACEMNSGGKKGWIDAGEITVGESIAVSDKTKFTLRYFPEVIAAAIEGIEYTYEAPQPATDGERKAAKLTEAARQFRAGKPVVDELVVECVAHNYLSQSEAMNRDF